MNPNNANPIIVRLAPLGAAACAAPAYIVASAPRGTDVQTPFWYGVVWVDPSIGRPIACQSHEDPELRGKTRLVVTGRASAPIPDVLVERARW